MEAEGSSQRTQEHIHRFSVMWPTIDNKTCQSLLELLQKTEESNCAQTVTR
jgi:hypothetical protein